MATEKNIPISEATSGSLDNVATTAVTRADSSTAYRQEMVVADDTTDAARAKVANAAAGETDYGLFMRSIPQNTIASGALGALNATLTIPAADMRDFFFSMPAATNTLIGTVSFQVSYDGGTTYLGIQAWDRVDFDNPVTSIASTSGTAFYMMYLIGVPVTHVRVKVTAYTSGSGIGNLIGSVNSGFIKGPLGLPAAVMGRSTLPTVDDNALVVALSPNSATPSDSVQSGSVPVGTPGNTVQFTITSVATLLATTSGSLSGSPTFITEVSTDAVTWIPISGQDPVFATLTSAITNNQTLRYDVTGFIYFRIRVVVAGTGTMSVNISQSTRVGPASMAQLTGALPAGSNTIGSVEITDGVDTAAVTSASTAAVAADKALVVSLSPNMPKTLPTNGLGMAAVPVYNNAIQLATYTYGIHALATGTLSAGTAKPILSIDHAVSATKTVRIRRILVSGYQTTALAGLLSFQINTGTAQASAGTVLTGGKRNLADPSAECVVRGGATLPTIVAATVQDTLPGFANPTTTATGVPATVIYDWQEGGETKPWTLRAGVLESFVLEALSNAAQAWNLTIHITLTEE